MNTNQVRKKNLGTPGNGGQYAGLERPAAQGMLSDPASVAKPDPPFGAERYFSFERQTLQVAEETLQETLEGVEGSLRDARHLLDDDDLVDDLMESERRLSAALADVERRIEVLDSGQPTITAEAYVAAQFPEYIQIHDEPVERANLFPLKARGEASHFESVLKLASEDYADLAQSPSIGESLSARQIQGGGVEGGATQFRVLFADTMIAYLWVSTQVE